MMVMMMMMTMMMNAVDDADAGADADAIDAVDEMGQGNCVMDHNHNQGYNHKVTGL